MLQHKSFVFYILLVCCSAFLILLSLFWGVLNVLADQGNQKQTEQMNQSGKIAIATSPSSAFIGGSNLAPGDQIQSTIYIHNDGQLDFEYGLTARKQSGSQLLYDLFDVQVEHGNQLLYSGLLRDLQQIDMGPLPSGSEDQLTFTVNFPLYAGNEYQGLEVVAAFDFTAYGETETGTEDNPDYPKDPEDKDQHDTAQSDTSQPVVSQTDHFGSSGGKLPQTATHWYNLLLLGIVLLVIGSYLLWRYRKQADHSVYNEV